jgi:hypothetical protein
LAALIAVNLAMIFIAVARYRALFSQPRARFAVVGPVAVLIVYAVVFLWIGSTRRLNCDKIMRSVALYGLLGGILDVLNIAAENGIPIALHIPALAIVVMLTLFGSWTVLGFRTTRALGSIGAGVLAAVFSAGVCMLVGVAGGFATQFFIHPPEPAYVATWAEFKRSGWTDARAFGLANTLDSALTHLVIAPTVALVFGGGASLLAQLRFGKRGNRISAESTTR